MRSRLSAAPSAPSLTCACSPRCRWRTHCTWAGCYSSLWYRAWFSTNHAPLLTVEHVMLALLWRPRIDRRICRIACLGIRLLIRHSSTRQKDQVLVLSSGQELGPIKQNKPQAGVGTQPASASFVFVAVFCCCKNEYAIKNAPLRIHRINQGFFQCLF